MSSAAPAQVLPAGPEVGSVGLVSADRSLSPCQSDLLFPVTRQQLSSPPHISLMWFPFYFLNDPQTDFPSLKSMSFKFWNEAFPHFRVWTPDVSADWCQSSEAVITVQDQNSYNDKLSCLYIYVFCNSDCCLSMCAPMQVSSAVTHSDPSECLLIALLLFSNSKCLPQCVGPIGVI